MVRDIIHSSDVCVQLGWHGRTLLEAMAMKKPLITSKREAETLNLVEHGKNGLLVDAKNPKEVAETILSIVNNKELARKLGKNARKKAEMFSVERVADRVESFLYRVLEEQSKSKERPRKKS